MMRPSAITVLVNAGPWLLVPPVAYGGLENVVATLIPELRRRGVRVVLATVGESEPAVDEVVSAFAAGQFDALNRPYNQVGVLAHAHAGRRSSATSRRHRHRARPSGDGAGDFLPLRPDVPTGAAHAALGSAAGGGVLPGVRRSRPRLGERVSSTQSCASAC